MSCEKCGYEFTQAESQWCCSGCSNMRCKKCDPFCENDDCENRICSNEPCLKRYSKCNECLSQCWICGYIPYPPSPSYIHYAKFGNFAAVIGPRCWTWKKEEIENAQSKIYATKKELQNKLKLLKYFCNTFFKKYSILEQFFPIS